MHFLPRVDFSWDELTSQAWRKQTGQRLASTEPQQNLFHLPSCCVGSPPVWNVHNKISHDLYQTRLQYVQATSCTLSSHRATGCMVWELYPSFVSGVWAPKHNTTWWHFEQQIIELLLILQFTAEKLTPTTAHFSVCTVLLPVAVLSLERRAKDHGYCSRLT